MNNVDNIIKANLHIVNKTAKVIGSGTHIKIYNKSYVLTVAHLLDTLEDKMIARNDTGFLFENIGIY